MEEVKSCQSRAVECARRAVYTTDPKARKAYTEAAAWWAKRAQEFVAPTRSERETSVEVQTV
jgi:hypothetical protein